MKWGINIIVVLILSVIAIGWATQQSFVIRDQVVYEGTIQPSKVTSYRKPFDFFIERYRTDVEIYGGEKMLFWGDLTSQIEVGQVYKISYRHLTLMGNARKLLLSITEIDR